MLAEGLQLGRYRLLRMVGRGATSEVYLAEDQRVNRQVTLKVVQSENLANEEARDMALLFQREAHTIAKLNHPNILPLFDFGEELVNGTTLVYLVMPYCPEGSLANWLRQRIGSLILQPHDVLHIVQQAADALEYAHEQQIVHRDVKPSNFLIRSRRTTADRPDLLLADFGIARFTHGTINTSTTIRGTPSYMSPEQWSGYAVPASDQYALAIMAYELLTGHPPFLGTQQQVMYQHFMAPPPPPSTVNLHLTPAIDAVILRALAKQPEARFPSITAFAHALQQAVQPATHPFIIPQQSPLTPIRTTLSPPTPLPPSLMPPGVKDTPAISIPAGQRNDVVEPVVIETIPGLLPPRITQRRLLLGGLALLLVIASIVGLFSFGPNLFASKALSATATTNPANGAISTSDAATTSAVLTKNAQATATSTTTGNFYVSTYNTLALNETLDKNSQVQWDETPGSCVFTAAGYHVIGSSQATLAQICLARKTNFTDMAFEVQMSLLGGDAGGILLRATTSASYYFRISSTGYYTLFLCAATGTLCNKPLLSSFSGQIKQGLHQSNVIAVAARGNLIELYVNDERISSINDGSSSSGQIGLVAEVGSEVVFSHARVWTA
jgi:eukaryotic-like serine/threonine-protein kinase